MPELFITQDPMPNAMTLGSDKPFIVITTGLVDLLDAEEHRFVIGHELGHVLSGHAVYRTMLYILTSLAARLAWFAIGYIGLRVIIAGLEEWYRKSELSCDRAGVLASQDPAAARRALMKIAGGSRISELSPDEFLRQAHEYDAVPDVREGLLKMLQMLGTTHPFAVVRFAELDRWVAEGEYEAILAGNYPRREDDATPRCRTSSWPRPSPTRSPGIAARTRSSAWSRGSRRPPSGPGNRCSGTSSVSGAAAAAAAAGATTDWLRGTCTAPRLRTLPQREALSRTRSSRCTISRSYSGPRWAASSWVERPIIAGISDAS